MPLDDDGDDDGVAFGVPLPPDDRLWRHPSEVAAPAASASPRPADAPSGSKVWGVAIASGLVGAVLTVGVATATVGLGTERGRTAVERVAVRPLGAALVSSSGQDAGVGAVAVARALQPSVAHVSAGSDPRVGSAVVLRDDGYLLTSADLIGDATTVRVTLEGAELTGTVVGTDRLTDVAVVHVDRTGLVPAITDGGAGAAVGQRAFVVAATRSGAPKVTAGIVGATDRQVTAGDGTVLHGMVQTDAPVDAVALGGPLTDERGVVLGLLATSGGAAGGGHAIPIAVARTVGDDIASTGTAHHVWLGIEGNDLTDGKAADLAVSGGAAVTKVAGGSPAAAAGLEGGDVITAVDGRSVASMSELVVHLRAHRPGDTVTVDYWRNGERRAAAVTLAERRG